MLSMDFADIFLNLFVRYALREGAAAIAVDIEEIVDVDQKSGWKPVIKIVPHTVQRRGEADCRKKDEAS